MAEEQFSRRDLLRLLGVGGLSLFLKGCLPQTMPINRQFPAEDPDGELPDLEISLKAVPDRVQILPGERTLVWRYVGEVITGAKESLQELENSYLGPVIHAKIGDSIRIHFKNELPEPSIIHWHGLHVPPAADGHPRLVIGEGETYIYDFIVADRAGTYWYHPHPHGRTGPQVYAGLAGLIIIHDPEEEQLGLPSGAFDIPLVLQDRDFDTENQLIYGMGHMMDRMIGFLGSQIMVNGQPEFKLSVHRRPYRLRIINGSNSRVYKVAWDDGRPISVLATDGGLLEFADERESVVLAPAQRIDIWVDFSQDNSGTMRELISLPFDSYGGQVAYSLVQIDIGDGLIPGNEIPEKLSAQKFYDQKDAVNRFSPRTFTLSFAPGMVWTINGRTFEMGGISRDEIVKLGDLEVWAFENRAGSGMGMMGSMSLPHPMHVHGLQFQILEREISSDDAARWKSLRESVIDQGWHDTVLVFPGEKVKILVKFEDFSGLYLYHCHNLEHEDMGMMRNFQVKE